MTAELIETESFMCVFFPKEALPKTAVPIHPWATTNSYTLNGVTFPFSETVLTAVKMWGEGKTAAEIATAVGLGDYTDHGQAALLGAIRRVCPEALPPRHAPKRRHRA